MKSGSEIVALVRRWEDAGGVWRVLDSDREAVTVALYRCDGGEEADRFVSTDPRLVKLLDGRTSSHDPLPPPQRPAGHPNHQTSGERD